jgi:hypothetical protein
MKTLKTNTTFTYALTFMTMLLFAYQTNAQSDQEVIVQSDQETIAQKMQNPLSNISALPIQNNFLFGASQNDELGYGLSFQPIHSSSFEKFNIVHRAVFGIGYTPGITGGLASLPQGAPDDGEIDGTWGTTDLNYSFFYTPKKANKVAWGIGPSVNLPTASDNRLGTGKWSAGLSGVLVFQTGKWTFDWVMRQTWSFAGDENRRDVNQMVLQPLIAYNLGNGWVASTMPSISANWGFDDGQKWTIPLGAGFTKVLFIGKTPMALTAQYYSYAVRPDLAPTSEFRIGTTIVFSK